LLVCFVFHQLRVSQQLVHFLSCHQGRDHRHHPIHHPILRPGPNLLGVQAREQKEVEYPVVVGLSVVVAACALEAAAAEVASCWVSLEFDIAL